MASLSARSYPTLPVGFSGTSSTPIDPSAFNSILKTADEKIELDLPSNRQKIALNIDERTLRCKVLIYLQKLEEAPTISSRLQNFRFSGTVDKTSGEEALDSQPYIWAANPTIGWGRFAAMVNMDIFPKIDATNIASPVNTYTSYPYSYVAYASDQSSTAIDSRYKVDQLTNVAHPTSDVFATWLKSIDIWMHAAQTPHVEAQVQCFCQIEL